MLLVVLEGSLLLTRQGGELVAVTSQLDSVRVSAAEAQGILACNQLRTPCTMLVVESQMRAIAGRQCGEWLVAGVSPTSTMDALPSLPHPLP